MKCGSNRVMCKRVRFLLWCVVSMVFKFKCNVEEGLGNVDVTSN